MAVLALAVAVAGCSSGGGEGCDTEGGTALAASPWPKFRKDLGNTGRIDAMVATVGNARWVFPPHDQPALDAELTSPVITSDGKVLIVARRHDFPTQSRAYLIDSSTGAESLGFDVTLATPVGVSAGAAPLISATRIAIIFSDGTLRQFDLQGTFIGSLPTSGTVVGSPTIDSEGTMFTATTSGVLSSLCANGGNRYLLAIGGSESSVALREGDTTTVNDDVAIIASNDAKVRAFSLKGEALWTFTASAAVRATVVYDVATDLVYGADTNGQVFVLRATDPTTNQPDGRRCRNLSFNVGAPVIASPALANGVLYVVSTDGVLRALDVGAVCDVDATQSDIVERWRYDAEAPVSSSPAVAVGGGAVVVFGTDDGTVHAVVDRESVGERQWTFCTQERAPIGRSSVAIDAAGSVYVTTSAGRLYAIGDTTDATATPCSTATVTSTVAVTNTSAATSVPTAPNPTSTATLTETPLVDPSPTDSPTASPSRSPSASPTGSPGS
jgi:hypothetical protein